MIMKNASLLIVRVAVIALFIGGLSASSLLASAESPRGMWMAEWIRPQVAERAIGVLTLRDGKLSFAEQAGGTGWEVELANVRRVGQLNARSLVVVTDRGEEYVAAIMDPSLTRISPKKVVIFIERALQLQTTNSR